MNKLETLKATLKATTPGTWRYAVDLSAVVVLGKYEIKAVADFGKIDDSTADAEFIALAHNLMPDLLEALTYLADMCQQADEGTPQHLRSGHFTTTLVGALDLLEKLK